MIVSIHELQLCLVSRRCTRSTVASSGRNLTTALLAEGAVDLLVAARRLAGADLPQEGVELGPRRAVDDAGDRPDEREEEEVLDPQRQLLRDAAPSPRPQPAEAASISFISAVTRVISSVAGMPTASVDLHSLRTKRRHGGTSQPKRLRSLSLVRREARGQRVEPRGEQRLPAELRRLDVDHAAARHGRGRGDGEVLHLEDHRHGRGHGDHLARHEAELLVVVEHRVHVLDPDGVDGPVEEHPLAVGDACIFSCCAALR